MRRQKRARVKPRFLEFEPKDMAVIEEKANGISRTALADVKSKGAQSFLFLMCFRAWPKKYPKVFRGCHSRQERKAVVQHIVGENVLVAHIKLINEWLIDSGKPYDIITNIDEALEMFTS